MNNDTIKSRSNFVAAPLALGLALSIPHLAFAQVDASNLVDVGAEVATSIDADAVDAKNGVELDSEAQIEVEANTRAKSAVTNAKAETETAARAQVDSQVQSSTNVQTQVEAGVAAKSAEAKATVSVGADQMRSSVDSAKSQATDAMAQKRASATGEADTSLSAVAESADGEALKIDLKQLDASTKEQIRSGKNVVITGQFSEQDEGVSAASEAEATGDDDAVSATVLKGASASGADLLLINGKQKVQTAIDASADLSAAENAAVAAKVEAEAEANSDISNEVGTGAADIQTGVSTSINSAVNAGKGLSSSIGLGGGVGTNAAVDTRSGLPRLATLSPKKIEGGTVLSGGIGEEEEARMLDMKSNYNLRLTFAAEGSGTYLADVLVNIEAEGVAQPLVNLVSTGPLFYADLPSGEYTIRATSNAKTNVYLVTLDGSASKDVILTW